MTVVVAFLCSDGVVVAADSMLTPSAGNVPTGHITGRKIHILNGPQISAFSGDQGAAARFRVMADLNHQRIAAGQHPLDYGLVISSSMATQFQGTGIWPNVDLATVLAYLHGGRPHCCAFMGRIQPWLLDQDHYYVALGSGKLSADPFLTFLTSIFCRPSRPPTVREAIFLATWTVQHVIDVNPGGVAGPIRVAVLEKDAEGAYQARELPPTEIEEHRQAMESAKEALRSWRQTISGQAEERPSGASAGASDGGPTPPVPPEIP